jgi:hypothetical protein
VAEISKMDTIGEVSCCMHGRANPLMDRKVVGIVFFGVVALVKINHNCSIQHDIMWCSSVVVVIAIVIVVVVDVVVARVNCSEVYIM